MEWEAEEERNNDIRGPQNWIPHLGLSHAHNAEQKPPDPSVGFFFDTFCG